MPHTVLDRERDKLSLLHGGATGELSRDALGEIIGRPYRPVSGGMTHGAPRHHHSPGNRLPQIL